MSVSDGYYAVLFKEPKSKTVGVRFPDHPSVITYGRDWKEAEEHAREALSAALEAEFERGATLPRLSKPKAKRNEKVVFVPIDPEVRTAYLLRAWRETAGFTQKQIAQQLGVSYQAYQRMERPGRANLTVRTLKKIAKVFQGELVLDLRFSNS
ncbi:MAG TPA: type II toxin-antitoxin system HicB family antitoxin [Bdellovibrionota bacterium]|nr:type II toxin-antitoxin system HicB family antitoxin [Bdellovibrionota bacterium]